VFGLIFSPTPRRLLHHFYRYDPLSADWSMDAHRVVQLRSRFVAAAAAAEREEARALVDAVVKCPENQSAWRDLQNHDSRQYERVRGEFLARRVRENPRDMLAWQELRVLSPEFFSRARADFRDARELNDRSPGRSLLADRDGLVLGPAECARLGDQDSYRPQWDDTVGDYWGGMGDPGMRDPGE